MGKEEDEEENNPSASILPRPSERKLMWILNTSNTMCSATKISPLVLSKIVYGYSSYDSDGGDQEKNCESIPSAHEAIQALEIIQQFLSSKNLNDEIFGVASVSYTVFVIKMPPFLFFGVVETQKFRERVSRLGCRFSCLEEIRSSEVPTKTEKTKELYYNQLVDAVLNSLPTVVIHFQR
ncbi:hypothetical protein C0J52_26227 [Blattella germanica]|nr:hypothetical protein C0J52_26227 [Blattella germanica]